MRILERGREEAMGVAVPERSEGERSEAERSVGTATPIAGASAAMGSPAASDPEVSDKPSRRHFSLEYKLSLLKRADACKPGQLGALLRREGVYSSTLSQWRRQRQQGMLSALRPVQRGRKPMPPNPLASRVSELERENKQLKRKLQQAETLIEVQKKLSDMLGISLNPPHSGDND